MADENVIKDLLAAQRERDKRPVPTEGPEIVQPAAPSLGDLRQKERDVIQTFRPVRFTERLKERLQERFEERVKPLREERARAVSELKTTDLFGPAADLRTKRLLQDIDFMDQRIKSNQSRINEFAQTATSGFVEDRKVALSEIQSLIKEQKDLETQKQQKESQAFQRMLALQQEKRAEQKIGFEERRLKLQEAQFGLARQKLALARAAGSRVAGGVSTPIPESQVQYTPEQEAVLSGLDPQKITGTTLSVLKDAGLSSTDLFKFHTDNRQVKLTTEKRGQIEEILQGIKSLEGHEGFNAAVGFGLQKLIPFKEDFISGTNARNFQQKFNSFRDNLTLPSLEKLKGAMSDKDIQFLRNSATSLDLGMSEDEFIEELERLKGKFQAVLDIDEEGPAVVNFQGTSREDAIKLLEETGNPVTEENIQFILSQ